MALPRGPKEMHIYNIYLLMILKIISANRPYIYPWDEQHMFESSLVYYQMETDKQRQRWTWKTKIFFYYYFKQTEIAN